MTKCGFTLIELLVVVLIIGILAGVALPQYQNAVHKTRLMNLIQTAAGIRRAQEAFYPANDKYTSDLHSLDVDFTKTCSIRTDTSILDCPDAYLDNIKGDGSVLDHNQVYIVYRPGAGLGGAGVAAVNVYFSHSARPNEIICTGMTQAGVRLCKSLNLN